MLLASAAEAVLTVGVAAAGGARGRRPPCGRSLRLRRFGSRALIATVVGIALFVLVVMLLPATLLGREGIAPIALARDLPLQGPASVLQSFAQELQFRGLLLGALDRVAPPWAANLGQAAFFGLAHIAVQYQGPARRVRAGDHRARLGARLGHAAHRLAVAGDHHPRRRRHRRHRRGDPGAVWLLNAVACG